MAGIVGGLNGINACGLAVTSAMLLDCPSRNGTARGCLHSVIVKLLLEEAADIDSALAILRRLAKRGAWGICLSHHPSQRLCYLEYDGESLQIRHESTLAAANHSLLFPSRAEACCHSRHRLTSLEEMLRRRSPEGLAAREAQETLRSRYDPARGRGTAHPTMNTLCRVDNQISIVMEPQRGRVWATSGPLGSDDPDRFYCLPIGSLLGTGRTPLSLVPGGNPVLHESRAGAEVKGERAEPLEPPCVAERFVMRMIPVPLRPDLPAAPAWQGPVLIVGRNLSAQALRVRLEAGGALVREIPSDDLDAAIAAFDRIWQEGPVPHLFLMTGRDGIATDPYDEAVWQERACAASCCRSSYASAGSSAYRRRRCSIGARSSRPRR